MLFLWEQSSYKHYEEQQESHETGRIGQDIRLISGQSLLLDATHSHPGLFAGTEGVQFHL